MASHPPLKKIKSGTLARGFALAKVSVSVGAKAASYAVGGLFAGEKGREDRGKALLTSQLEIVSRELGMLKGSLMKVGQMLSVMGEHFLPPEANAVLKSLQSQSPPLDWPAVEKVLKRQLGPEKLAELEIDHEPLASASLGQVHRARRKRDGAELALKIQYPGVDAAVESDLRALKNILRISRLLPKGPNYEELFREVKSMLKQEVDYRKELEATDFFREALTGDRRYIVAKTYPEYSTNRVLALSLEMGIPVDSPEVLSLPEERRNAIAEAALDLYFRELFEFQRVQTDPHFGNYRIRIGKGGEPDQIILFDFGAVRIVPDAFLASHRALVRGGFYRDAGAVEAAARKMGFLQPDDSEELVRHFTELCFLILEPFADRGSEPYDWGASDLPKRVARHATQIIFGFRLRVPPREVVFLDRKMGGMFIFLHVLKARFQGRAILEKYIGR